MDGSRSAYDDTLQRAIDVAYRSAPEGWAASFQTNDFAFIDNARGPLPELPWKGLASDAGASLLDLLDSESHEDATASLARSLITGIASTTVRTLMGQPVHLTLFVSGPDADAGVALIDDSPLLPLVTSDDTDSIRTRLICNRDGVVTATEGPPGSYATADIELGPWGTRLIANEDRHDFEAAIQLVLADEPYAAAQLSGAAPSLYFSVVIIARGDDILVDLYDHSHRAAAISSLKRSQTLFDQLSETLPVGVFVVETEGRMTFASERLREMFGPRVNNEFGWLEVIHPDDQAAAGQAITDLPDKRHFNIEVRAERADGDMSWMRLAGSDVRTEDGTLEYIVGFAEDVSEMRELHKRIEYQASFDGLTDLPNRMTLVDALRGRLDSQIADSHTGVLFIDLDGFKLINDTQGHSVGDVVLLEVAQRFRRALRPKDLIGRFGGDEFVVVTSDISGPEEAIAIGRRLHDILSTPVLAEGRIITVNASIGIAISEHAASTSEQLIGDADIAMYEAKANGRNRSVVFDATLRARASQRFDMTADLRHARRRRELRLEYQPIVDLHTNQMVGAEALVRWEHPAMGRISPAVFIPLAEEIGLIDDVGEWVVEQACADLDRLRGRGLVSEQFTVSINASAQQFTNVAILATSSLASLDQFGLHPSNLRFELTESVPLTQIPDAANRIRQLTSYGFGLAIDDFGTGYSSLGYLTMLPFDVLKLDLSLTAQLEPGSPALAVVDSLTRMATEMEFDIVAEGIETDKQMALLSDAGVRLGQGYFISRPVPLGQLIDKIEDGNLGHG